MNEYRVISYESIPIGDTTYRVHSYSQFGGYCRQEVCRDHYSHEKARDSAMAKIINDTHYNALYNSGGWKI